MNNFLIKIISIIKNNYIKGKIKIWLTFISFLFIANSILNNLSNIFDQNIDDIEISLISAIIITCISVFLNALSWKFLLNSLGYKKNKINIIKLFIKSNLLKYLPGGFWHFAERIRVLNTNISIEKSLASIILEILLMIVSGFVWISLGDGNLIFRICSIFSILILHPFFIKILFRRFGNLFGSKFRDIKFIQASLDLRSDNQIVLSNYPYKALCVEILFIGCRFLGFWICLDAFSISNNLYFLNWASIFSFAWIIGLIVPSAPGGVGIFEATILLVLRNKGLDAPLISALLCYRFISTVSDVLMYLLARLKLKK